MNLGQKIKNDNILNIISEEFDNEVWLVGGAVRDFVLGKDTYDRDLIVCDEDARSFSLKLAKRFDAVFVPLDEENRIYRLVFRDKVNYLDVTNPVGNSLEIDLRRRDLTINAVAVNLKTGEVKDLFNGLDDLQNKRINMICEQNFLDDPLRLLRVFRFQADLGFKIDEKVLKIVQKHAKLIHKPAFERINYEILKLFAGNFTHEALLSADECGLTEEIFPVTADLKRVPPNSHHHLDLFHHSVETVRQINELYKTAPAEVQEHLNRVDFGGMTRLVHLKLAGFLHDIGKFSTWTIEEGRHRFIKHDIKGAEIASKFLKNMRFSNRQISYITDMIRYHIYPSQVMAAPEITDKIMMRYVRRMYDNSIDCIILAMADRLSARGPEITGEIIEKNLVSLTRLLDFYLNVRETLKPLPKLLNGNDVMNILEIKPSHELGEIMDALHEAQFNGDVTTRDEAVKFVKKIKDK